MIFIFYFLYSDGHYMAHHSQRLRIGPVIRARQRGAGDSRAERSQIVGPSAVQSEPRIDSSRRVGGYGCARRRRSSCFLSRPESEPLRLADGRLSGYKDLLPPKGLSGSHRAAVAAPVQLDVRSLYARLMRRTTKIRITAPMVATMMD